MRGAVSAARRCGGGNGAVVVEPASGRVLASSAEVQEEQAGGGGGVRAGAAGHPLRHAVMRVIDAMAARDRTLWPDAPRTVAAVTDAPGASSLKRQRLKSRSRGGDSVLRPKALDWCDADTVVGACGGVQGRQRSRWRRVRAGRRRRSGSERKTASSGQ